jgi:hypothetical protein
MSQLVITTGRRLNDMTKYGHLTGYGHVIGG